ncbi:hypothetical protein KAH55_09035, partial [bacterium]|nr:hypothetical protein [bacterium]
YTGRITVSVGALHHMEMQHWVNGSMTDSVNTDFVMTLLVVGYDAEGNVIPDGGSGNPKQNATWTFTSGSDKGDLSPILPASGYEGILTPKIASNCIIRATNVNNAAIWVDSPLITILAGSPARLVLLDQAGSSGQPIGDISLRADESLRVWAGAEDVYGNFISQATPPWTYEDITLTNVAEITPNGEYADIDPKLAGGQFRVIISHAVFVDDSTGVITVTPGDKHHLKILQGGSGPTAELGDTTLTVGSNMLIHAASYDLDDNYSGDEILNVLDDWSVIGGVGRLEQGPNAISVRFVPTKIGTGLIKVEQSGIQTGYSGSVTVESGQVTSFQVHNGPDGSGDDVSSLNMTTDDVANLYAAGYDAGGNYIEDVVVDWTSSGWVTDSPYSTTDTFIEFNPTKTGSDSIFASHTTTGVMDTVVVNQVLPGEPYGDGGLITLTPDRQQIPADGVTTVLITSNEIVDRDGNLVSEGVHFTVRATLGEIVTADLDTTVADTQVAVNGAGKIQFEFKASSGGGTANIYANSLSAQGMTTVNISNVEIVSVSTEKNTVSLGQDSIAVRMLVENLGSQAIQLTQAELNFENRSGFDRKSDYTIIPPVVLPQIPAGATDVLNFWVRVHDDAVTDTVIIDGELDTDVAGIQIFHATQPDSWRVQTPGAIEVLRVEALEDTVTQGMSDLDVWMRIRNNSGEFGAIVKIDSLKPTFWRGSQNVTDQYISSPIGVNKDSLAGQEEAVINFKLNVNNGAFKEDIRIDGAVYGHDINSDSLVQDTYADSTDRWRVEQAATIQLASLGLSQSKITRSQSRDWYAILRVRNNGQNPVELDTTKLQFLSLNEDITSQYVVVSPDTFLNGKTYLDAGTEEELWVTVDSTGTRLGTVTVRAEVELHDVGVSGVSLKDRRETLVLVQEAADVAIYGVGLSQPEVTRGQERDWKVKVAVANSGGSTVEVNYAQTNLKFATGSDFVVLPPIFQDGGGGRLAEGAADTLVFVVDHTGASHGNSNITVNLVMNEVTSGREISLVDNSTSVLIQTKPKIGIKTLTNEAINAPSVNKKQQFNIGVILHNSGGGAADEADGVKVELRSNRQSARVWTKVAHDVYYGAPQKIVFTVNAADTVGLVETFVANIVEAREG